MMESETRTAQGQILGSAWRKSSYCANGECVEVREHSDAVAVRSSSAPDVVLRCTVAQFTSFLQTIKIGELDHLC